MQTMKCRHHVGVSRRMIAWIVTLPLAVAGTQMAHAIAYRITASTNERAHELSATGHGYLAYLPLALAIGAVLVAFALAAEVRHVATRSERAALRPRAWQFAIVAPAIFVSQEHFERLSTTAHSRGVPPSPDRSSSGCFCRFHSRSPRMGSLDCFYTQLGRSEVSSHSGGDGSNPPRPVAGFRFRRSRLPALAFGYGSRGPPLPSR